jgi:peptide/nickel transport system substrate-binding protein
MKRHRLLKVSMFVLLAALVAVGGIGLQPGRAQAKTALNVGLANNVDILDPTVTTFSSVGFIMGHVFSPLVYQQPLGTFEPGLASEWSINADATEYTFKLRQDAKFHDGTPVNAQAVKFTFDRVANPDTKSQLGISLLGPYQETVVADDYTFTVKFKSPFAPFLNSVSTPYLAPISPAAVEKAGAEWGVSTITGSGPFKFESYTPNAEVVLARNDDYNWAPALFGVNGASKLEKITFKIILDPATRLAALESGEVDFINNVPENEVARLKGDAALNILEIEQPGSGWSLMMNVEKAPTSELAVRRAIALGSDKQGMIDTVFSGLGKPGCSPLTSVMFGYDPKSCEYLPYNPDEAKKILDEAGWTAGADGIRVKDGQRLVIEHYFRTGGAPGTAMATFMKADLAKIGIEVNLNGLEGGGYFEAVRAGKHNSQNWWDTGTDPDQVRVLFYGARANGGTNRNRYKSDAMDKLIDAAAGTPDPAKRAELYAQIQKLAADDAVMVFYVDPLLLYGHTKSLDGVTALGGGNLMNFYAASFK